MRKIKQAPAEEELAPVSSEPEVKPRVKARPTKFRVTRETLVNINGYITRLVEGQVLDSLGYSEETIASLRTQGVVLEPVE